MISVEIRWPENNYPILDVRQDGVDPPWCCDEMLMDFYEPDHARLLTSRLEQRWGVPLAWLVGNDGWTVMDIAEWISIGGVRWYESWELMRSMARGELEGHLHFGDVAADWVPVEMSESDDGLA
jgi:hypothetical protein